MSLDDIIATDAADQPVASSADVKVYLVGSGPGDPGLVTLRAQELVRNADVLVYDYLASTPLIDEAPSDAERIYVGKKGFERHVTQDDINRILVDKARELSTRVGESDHPLTLVRLKGGDPFVFGRGGEEALALAEAGIAFEVVPGITSGIAAPAYAGIPVTHRGIASSVTFVTGNEDPTKSESDLDWDALAALARQGDTLCFYMGMRNLPKICTSLVDRGVSPTTPIALVQWGTTSSQRTLVATLDDIAERANEAGMAAPVMIVVGPVCGLREKIGWLERRPLFARRILVTRSRTQASELVDRLSELGADVIEFPTIEICPPDSYDELDEAVKSLGEYEWVVFTSVNGVDSFFERLSLRKGGPRDARALAGCSVAAIGPATARRLASHGVVADVMPREYRAEAVFEALEKAGLEPGDRVLIPRALEAREALPRMLEEAGAHVTLACAYKTVAPQSDRVDELKAALSAGTVDAVTFTSSSTVKNLVALLGQDATELLSGTAAFSIGPVTSATATDLGLTVAHEARSYTIDGLVSCLCRELRREEAIA